MSSSSRRTASASSSASKAAFNTWTTNMNTFEPESFALYNPKTQRLEDWARMHARRYFHDVDRTTPFAFVYTTLITYARNRIQDDKLNSTTFTVTDSSSGWSTRKSASGKAAPVPVPAPAPAQMTTSHSVDAATLNRACWREYTNWWEAFEVEGSEAQIHEGAPAEEARNRWVDHTARVLQRSTGYSYEALVSDVEAWFDRHAQ